MTYFKILAADGVSPYHGGSGKWFVPKGKRPGKWMPKIENIALCERGYHVVQGKNLSQWIGPSLYIAEIRGKIIAGDDKSVASEARLIRKIETWNDKTLRLFAADCAEHVLELYEKKYPNDIRPRNAIKAARDFAQGLIDITAAYAAANAAANAAYDAAYAAANAAAYAAYDAANDAADAEKNWQKKRLEYYLEMDLSE